MEIRSIAAFLKYYENIRKRTQRVVDTILRDRIEWTHQEAVHARRSRAAHRGNRAVHVRRNVQGNDSRYPGHGREFAEDYDNVMRYFEDMHAEAMDIFAGLTDADLDTKCTTPGGVSMSKWKWLRAMVEHEVHHRGQIYLMLGMLGVQTPPLYGLTSEQVYDRSVHD